MTDTTTLREKVGQIVNPFLAEWCKDNFPHLVDSDENAGQTLRDAIIDLIDQERRRYAKDQLERLSHHTSYLCENRTGRMYNAVHLKHFDEAIAALEAGDRPSN